MLRLNCLVATGVLALTVGYANATTFNVTGSPTLPLGGTITISSSGAVGPIAVTANFPPSTTLSPAFTVLDPFVTPPNPFCSSSGFCDITIDQVPAGFGFGLLLVLPVTTLVGYSGGAISETVLFPASVGPEDMLATCGVTSAPASAAACGSLTASTPPPVPLPATLPLFATGLGALGLLGWRRKKAAAG
jgi:hypothetical protein